MKKATSLVLVVILVLSLVGCGASSKPETVATNFCDALKSFDIQTVSSCFETGTTDIENPYSENSEVEQELTSDQAIEFLKTCAAKMTYTIGESTIDGDSAKVPVTFTYVDVTPVVTAALGDYISQALGLAFSGADDADIEELFGTIFIEKTGSVETKTATSDITLSCVKVDKEWKISALTDEEQTVIMTVLTCNISSAFDELNDDTDENSISEDIVWHDVTLGQELELETIKIRITNCEELQELTAEYYEPDVAQDGTKYIVFSVDIENITKDTMNFDNDLNLTDSQGRTYQSYSNALWYYDETFSYTDLAPNIKQSGNFIYNVPADSDGYYLTVQKANTNDAYRLYAK